jgi:hypothetical protein
MATVNKIEIAFHDAEFKKEVNQLDDKLNQLHAGIELAKIITDGNVTEFDLNQVNEYLKQKIDMPNLEAVADMLNQKQNYIQLKELHSKKDALGSEFIIYDNGSYKLTEEALNTLKMKHTTYLNEDKVSAYKKLAKAVEILNTLSVEEVASMQRNYENKYYINLLRLNTTFLW